MNVTDAEFAATSGDLSEFDEAREFFLQHITPLMLPDWSQRFKIVTDASNYGIGAALLQMDNGKERPIAFYSKHLTAAEMKWSTRDKEMLAFVVATQKWDYYVRGRHFIWQCDHAPLRHREDSPSDRVSRWYDKLSHFSYTFSYIPGPKNRVGDALSRAPVELPGHPDAPQAVPHAVIASLRSRAGRTEEREYVPKAFRSLAIANFHDDLGHPGVDVVLAELRQRYHWEAMAADVREYVRSCSTCQHTRGGGNDHTLQWTETTSPEFPWQKVSLDTMGIPEWGKYLCTCVDQFSKYVHARLVDRKEASTVMQAYTDMLFYQDGRPQEILTDNGTEFVWVEELSKRFGFKWWTTSVHHPQSNGMVERVHRTIVDKCLKLQVDFPQLGHEEIVKRAIFLCNNTIHHSTGQSPSLVQFGRNVQPPKREGVTADGKIKTHSQRHQAGSLYQGARGSFGQVARAKR